MTEWHRYIGLMTIVVCLVAGIAVGVLFQKYYGGGRLLTVIGLRTSAALPDPPPPARVAAGLPDYVYGRLSIFILAGQSNMSGRGDLPSAQRTDPRVFTFGNDYRWKPAREPVDDADGQIDVVSEDGPADRAGFGPALSFALALAERRSELVIGLVPCAKGDSTIDEWRRRLNDTTLYGSCVKRARAASSAGRLSGLLFFQGEADALAVEDNPHRTLTVERYGATFSQVVSDLRQDLARRDLPVVFAQIGTQTAPLAFPNWERIRQQQRSIALPCAAMIETSDLPLRDTVHFTTEAYQTIGRRFAAAYLGLMQPSGCHRAHS